HSLRQPTHLTYSFLLSFFSSFFFNPTPTPQIYTLSLHDALPISTRYRLDGSDWQPYSTPVLISGNGTHTLLYQSLDSGGLWEDVKSQSVQIDTTSPTTYCALDGPAGTNGVFLGDVHATLTTFDPDDTVAATRY